MKLNAPLESLLKVLNDTTQDPSCQLKELLAEAWSMMNHEQKCRFLGSNTVGGILAMEKTGDINSDNLIEKLQNQVWKMESAIINADYGIHKGTEPGTFYWELNGMPSEDRSRADTVVDAYQHLINSRVAN